eukprot:gene13694-16135_t
MYATSQYAYVTFVNNDQYAKGVVALKQSLDDTNTKYGMVVLITDKISPETIDRLQRLGCIVELVQAIPVPKEITMQLERWAPAFTKFRAWQMTQYSKIIWLDSDMLVQKNLDHLFSFINTNEPEVIYATVDADANSCLYKPERLKLINSGLVVLSPNLDIFNSLLRGMGEVAKKQSMVNDQDVMTHILKWRALEYPSYGVQITHCECQDTRLWELPTTFFLHYTAGLRDLPKPWQYKIDDTNGSVLANNNIPKCVVQLYKLWIEIYDKALDRIEETRD